MVTPAEAIETANREGFCHITQHVYLWKTCEASAHIRLENIRAPFFLITGPHGWEKFVPVATEKNRRLIKECNRAK